MDRTTAQRFATDPADWLRLLANTHLINGPRRWLVARCYLNPAGYIATPTEANERLYFSRYRPNFVRAGFEVIDCPTLARGKNAADIRMVIDALDLVGHPTFFDEFVLASGDSDFTPLLHRLRAEDRGVTILSPGYQTAAYASLADAIVGFGAICALVSPAAEKVGTPGPEAMPDNPGEQDNADPLAMFASFIRARFAAAVVPLNLAALAQEAARMIPAARESDWFGRASFSAALAALEPPHVRISQHHIWDDERHEPPPSLAPGDPLRQPEAVEELSRNVDLPRIRTEHWPRIFDTLASYANTHDFNLTEATSRCRDALAEGGVRVARAAIGYVIKGCPPGGVRLDLSNPVTADQIANAFLRSLIQRAAALGTPLEPATEIEVAKWLGASPESGQTIG